MDGNIQEDLRICRLQQTAVCWLLLFPIAMALDLALKTWPSVLTKEKGNENADTINGQHFLIKA
jgi:hypothetical protein